VRLVDHHAAELLRYDGSSSDDRSAPRRRAKRLAKPGRLALAKRLFGGPDA
jgi:hypothetical protein